MIEKLVQWLEEMKAFKQYDLRSLTQIRWWCALRKTKITPHLNKPQEGIHLFNKEGLAQTIFR